MTKTILLAMVFTSLTVFAQTPCENGFAGPYPCNGYDLMSFVSLAEMNAEMGNDSWGWTDTDTGKEYAIMGLNNGTAFVDISDPTNAIYLGKLPTQTVNSSWRDMKVFNNHAFIVSEASGHGMQIFDLTRLRNVTNPPVIFDNDAHYNAFGNAHNIAINEDTGYAYIIGTSTFNGGGHYVDISNPTNPIAAGGSSLGGYTHDAQIVVYNGPDSDYTGRELYLGSNEDEIVIIDVTNKTTPQLVSTVSYNNIGYTHQGWLTDDHSYFIVNDEFDEFSFGFNTRTLIFDFTDIDNPSFKFDYEGPTAAIDHNLYVKGNRLYLSNYRAGLRLVDISDIENNSIFEVGFFDSYPEDDITDFAGVWNIYPFFESGNIVISDVNRGLFIVKEPVVLSNGDFTADLFSIAPNPAKDFITVSAKENIITVVEMYNVLGQRVKNLRFTPTASKTININDLASGMYMVKINENTVTKLVKD